ncbi:MAG TPA: glycosyltransferase family 4 protein [Gemmatimonadaceae bacterium]|nr:glycosyltransferase family 4 protein [Gemmatimonadaceae bacterium]
MPEHVTAEVPAAPGAHPPTTGTAVGEYVAPRRARALRVVYLWDADYPWDVRVEKICATLVSAGHDVHIVARNRARRPLVERLPEGTVHRMPPWHWAGRRLDTALGFPAFFSPRWTGLLDRTIRRVRPDVVIGRDLPLAPTAIRVARRHGIPVVLDLAEHYPAMMQMIFDTGRQRPADYVVRNPSAVAAVERYALRRVDRVLVVVEEMAERLRAMGVPAGRIDLVSNTPPRARAMGPVRAAPAEGTDDDAPFTLVYLGLLEVVRGITELVEATALLRDRGVPVRVRIIGSGRDESLFRARAEALGLAPPLLEFMGWVPHQRAIELVAEADVGVLPLHANEALNHTVANKMFDYMAAALPVLTSSAIPSARIVRETGAGEVFESGSAVALADAVERLRSRKARAARGAAGRSAVLARYHWERDAAVLLDSVERAASGAGRGAGR